MAISRISFVQTLPGHEKEAVRLMQELVTYYGQQPGYIAGFSFKFHPSHSDRKENIGRVSVWESKDAADRAASAMHSAALRSQLNQHVGQVHEEWLVDVLGTPVGIPTTSARK